MSKHKRDSQEKEVEDKVQGYRTKVEERGEHPPWLYIYIYIAEVHACKVKDIIRERAKGLSYLGVPECSFKAEVKL